MSDITHIVYDIGDVLISYDPHRAFRELIPDDDDRSAFLSGICDGAWNLEQDRGRSWGEAEAALIDDHPGEEALIRAFRQNWAKMVRADKPDSVALYRSLIGDGLDVTLLTNFAADTFEEACGLFPFLNKARGATVSGRVGVVKPDEAIYRLHETTFDLDPARTLFIDDKADNITAARDHGWRGIHFTGAASLREDLETLGLARDPDHGHEGAP